VATAASFILLILQAIGRTEETEQTKAISIINRGGQNKAKQEPTRERRDIRKGGKKREPTYDSLSLSLSLSLFISFLFFSLFWFPFFYFPFFSFLLVRFSFSSPFSL